MTKPFQKELRIVDFPEAGNNGRDVPISRAYLQNGLYHNDYDAAILYVDGKAEYWLEGKRVSLEEHQRRKRETQRKDLAALGFVLKEEKK